MRRILQTGLLLAALVHLPAAAQPASSPPTWLQVIRDTPYIFSAGFYDNLANIRRWVLLEEGYCSRSNRHILFDQRGRFLTWLENAETPEATQRRLNEVRETLFLNQRVHRWMSGSDEENGYPFALSCDQPHVDMADALSRLLGEDPAERVWGTWNGIEVGSVRNPVALIDLVLEVFHEQSNARGIAFADRIAPALLGQIIIESGARKRSFSAAQAVGFLQLRPEVLRDCELDERFKLHRMAQVFCVVRLYQQIDRNIRPQFETRFGHLPDDKRERLYALLLVQAYHSGIGRMQQLLGDDAPGVAAQKLAADHERFSAEDLALGVVFHNLGRIDLGMASLYYLVDVAIAGRAVCRVAPTACPQNE